MAVSAAGVNDMRRCAVRRVNMGLSVRAVAEKVNIHRVTLSGIESGRVNPSQMN